MIEIPLIEPVVGDGELHRLREIFEKGTIAEGELTREFETRLADRVGTDHGIAVTSCTTGLEFALEAFGVGDDDEVVIPDFTFPATATAVERVGGEPVLVDVDPETYTIDPAAVERATTDETAAIVPVSWGGQPLSPTPLNEIARTHDCAIIEDAACAIGAEYDGEPVGSQFDASVFSFHPWKVLTTGEGGMITLDDDDRAERLRLIRNFGRVDDPGGIDFIRRSATNGKLSNVQAAMGLEQLDKLDEIIARRREVAATYDELLAGVDGIQTPYELDRARHTFQSYTVYVDAGGRDCRNAILKHLRKKGIQTKIAAAAVHQVTAFEDARRVGDLAVSRDLFYNLLTLPVTHTMSRSEQHQVVDALADGIEQYG